MPVTRSKTREMTDKKIEDVLSDLSTVLNNLSINNANLTNVINKMNEGVNDKLISLTDSIEKMFLQKDGDDILHSAASNKNNVLNEDTGGSRGANCCQPENNNYVSLWRDLGGANLFFSPDGAMHPVIFIKKLDNIFLEAGIPSSKKISFAVNCLRGSAQDWGVLKQARVDDYEEFRKLFLGRYWGIEEERKLFQKIKFGQYERGSRADYFLKMVREADFLTKPLGEDEIVSLVMNHFPPDIQRGILNSNSQTVDVVESYLRKIDSTYGNNSNWREQAREREGGSGVRGNRMTNMHNNYNNRQNRQQNGVNETGGQSNDRANIVSNSTVATMFNKNGDDLLLEEGGTVKPVGIMPTVEVAVESQVTRALIDSGSQVTCVSKKFFDILLLHNPEIRRLPCNCVTLMGALGNKDCVVREQAYLNLCFSEFEIDYPCLIVPGLVREIILGCDFMNDFQISINFAENIVSGIVEEQLKFLSFSGEPRSEVRIVVSQISEGEHCDLRSRVTKFYSQEEIQAVADSAEVFNEGEK